MAGNDRRPRVIAGPVLHVAGPGKLKIVNGRLAFATEHGVQLSADLQRLRQVLCYGPVGLTDDALRELLLKGVQVSFLSYRGANFRGTLSAPVPQALPLRKLQHRVLAENSARFTLARAIVARKVASQVEAIRRLRRREPDNGGQFDALLEGIRRIRHAVDQATSREELLGLEGSATAIWFEAFGKALRQPWQFRGRSRRPPQDPPNALLSLGYTMLTNRVYARCLAEGLETALGALHAEHPGRPSLACDLVEPLRVPVVDMFVLRVLNDGLLTPGDFRTENNTTRLTTDAFARLIGQWEWAWARRQHGRLVERTIRWFVEQLRWQDRVLRSVAGNERRQSEEEEENNAAVRGSVRHR